MKKFTAVLLCLLLLCTSAFGAGYSSETEAYSAADIVEIFTKLIGSRGGESEAAFDETESGFDVYVCADAFVLGSDYILYPMKIHAQEGESAASVIVRALEQCALGCENSGDVTENFYLSRIWGVELNPSPEAILAEWLEPIVSYYEIGEWQTGSLGEFDFTDMSGWMFFVNSVSPSIGMSDYMVSEGDVISLRFTLAYGMDLGCASFLEGVEPYVEAVNRDGVVVAIAEGVLDYSRCAEILSKASATQEEIDGLL